MTAEERRIRDLPTSEALEVVAEKLDRDAFWRGAARVLMIVNTILAAFAVTVAIANWSLNSSTERNTDRVLCEMAKDHRAQLAAVNEATGIVVALPPLLDGCE